eukprot:561546-Pyramimonas_sp.AAC.3
MTTTRSVARRRMAEQWTQLSEYVVAGILDPRNYRLQTVTQFSRPPHGSDQPQLKGGAARSDRGGPGCRASIPLARRQASGP